MAKRGRREYLMGRNTYGQILLERAAAPGEPSYEPLRKYGYGEGVSKETRELYKQYEKRFGKLLAVTTLGNMAGALRWAILEKNIITLPKTNEPIHINTGWGPRAKDWKFKNPEIGYLLRINQVLLKCVAAINNRLRKYPDSQLFCECGCGKFASPGAKYLDSRHGRRHVETLRRLRARLAGKNPWRDDMKQRRRRSRRRLARKNADT